MSEEQHLPIRRPSIASVFLEPYFGERKLGTATGFAVWHGEYMHLVTNWHVAAGRNNQTGEAIDVNRSVPDRLQAWFLIDRAGVTQWISMPISLYDDEGLPLWFEHPVHGRAVDVVALRFSQAPDIPAASYTLDEPLKVLPHIGPSDDLSVVGFPFGETAGERLAIWVRGTIASEPGVALDGLPRFLIDARTRPGQSGSPVIAYRSDGQWSGGPGRIITTPVNELFVGVYSGRLHKDSDLGYVWTKQALREVIEGQHRGPIP